MHTRYLSLFLVCCSLFVIGICSLLLHQFFRYDPVEQQTLICGNAIMDVDAANISDSTFADGKALFSTQCASCHNPVREATGPALVGIHSIRSREWLCRFLTERGFIPNDKRAVNLRKRHGLSCMKFPKMSCEEVDATLSYAGYLRR